MASKSKILKLGYRVELFQFEIIGCEIFLRMQIFKIANKEIK